MRDALSGTYEIDVLSEIVDPATWLARNGRGIAAVITS